MNLPASSGSKGMNTGVRLPLITMLQSEGAGLVANPMAYVISMRAIPVYVMYWKSDYLVVNFYLSGSLNYISESLNYISKSLNYISESLNYISKSLNYISESLNYISELPI